MRRHALIALCLALALAGCSGDTTPVRARNGTVTITIRDYRESPAVVEVRHGLISFRITNHGRLPHNFNIRGPVAVRLKISTMLPGESAQATVRLKRGEYTMYCSIGNHEKLGEYAKLIVR